MRTEGECYANGNNNAEVEGGLFIEKTFAACPAGRAISGAVSRWLPTAAARIWQVGFVVDKVASVQMFSEYFGFPCNTNHSTNFSIIRITRCS
jgi:hypothetical protein